MSLGKQIIERLRLLSSDGPEAVGLQSEGEYRFLTVDAGGTSARLEFSDYDRYSVALRALELGHAQPIAGDIRAYLSAHAAEIARRMSYLEEPLAVWELEGNEKIAQLRSSPPWREGEEVSYWEVVLSAGDRPGVRIMRYRWAPGMVEREPVIYPATFALIGRMADSLLQALVETGA